MSRGWITTWDNTEPFFHTCAQNINCIAHNITGSVSGTARPLPHMQQHNWPRYSSTAMTAKQGHGDSMKMRHPNIQVLTTQLAMLLQHIGALHTVQDDYVHAFQQLCK